ERVARGLPALTVSSPAGERIRPNAAAARSFELLAAAPPRDDAEMRRHTILILLPICLTATVVGFSCGDGSATGAAGSSGTTSTSGAAGTGGAAGSGGDETLFDGGSCQTGDPCDGGVCAGGKCCEVALACGDVCCAGGEVCSFQKCVDPGALCTDS